MPWRRRSSRSTRAPTARAPDSGSPWSTRWRRRTEGRRRRRTGRGAARPSPCACAPADRRAILAGMAVLTISADLGTPGEDIGRRVAGAAGMAFADADDIFELGRQMHPEIEVSGDFASLERRIGGRMMGLALGLAMTVGAP